MIHCGCAGFSRDAAECLAQRFQFTTAERMEQRERERICECHCHDDTEESVGSVKIASGGVDDVAGCGSVGDGADADDGESS